VVEYVLGRSNKVDEKFEVVIRGGDELLIVPILMVPTPAGWVGDELLIVPSPARMGDGLLVLFDPRSTMRSFDKPFSAAVERPGE